MHHIHIPSRRALIDLIDKAEAEGADAVILGCTEIGLLIGPQHTDLPVFDSTLLHSEAAVDFADGPAQQVQRVA